MTSRLRLSVHALALLVWTLALHEGVRAQDPIQALELTRGGIVSGVVIDISDDRLVLERHEGAGVVRQTVAFKDLVPSSVYAAAATSLSPLDADGHRRLADIAATVGLNGIAVRHYGFCLARGGEATPDLTARLTRSRDRDVVELLARSEHETEVEHFTQARRLLLSIMQRYPDHDAAATVPAALAELTKRYERARQRDAALAANRRAKAEWEKGERAIADVAKWLVRARVTEQAALRATEQFRSARDLFDVAIKQLRNAEEQAVDLRRHKTVPAGLLSELTAVEDEVITLHVRLRLHLASLYTVRGSFGDALATVNAALAFDPTDEQALAARARIEESAAVASIRVTTPRQPQR